MEKIILTEEILRPKFLIGRCGENIISFGSGQPDLPPPKEVFSVSPDYSNFRYGIVEGDEKLRKILSEQYPASTSDNFVITNGASEALDLSLRVIARNGDKTKNKVLMLKPYYYSYPHLVKFSGMEPVYTKSVKGRIDFDDFKEKVKDCKAVLINSPSNPTGRIESVDTLKKLEKLTEELGAYVLSDEVYKDLIYERQNYLIKGPRVVTINSFSKTFCMCGQRIGYLWSSDKNLVGNIINMKSHTSMNTNMLGQKMALEAMKVPKSFIDSQVEIWKQRRDLIYTGLTELGLEVWKPEGAFYILPRIENPKQFVIDMYNKYDVVTYPGEWFGAPDRVRFSYALDEEKIKEGLRRVGRYLKER
ncbi:MAG: pyridoxal phosphate-dependent aminotransferase [Candidatus Nanoarchaeia archaeon]|nr:pyridoxal phosphate-dependent aminotransferase [Candidatus Nanoarchaeia archaeon]MDD5741611.1 pyridoxal phosphate-dependent aminotransferase [Candidatus Nanoarchaeia archaeon]